MISAASRGNKEIVGFLLDKGASINYTNYVSDIMLDKHVHSLLPVMITDLCYCERSNSRLHSLWCCVIFSVFFFYDQNGYSSLISAAEKGHVETVRLLLDREAHIDGLDRVS